MSKATNDERPITMRSQIKGYSLRLTKGEDSVISAPGETPRHEMKYGKWADFVNGQCILQARTGRPGTPAYLSIWRTRDEAVNALKGANAHGRDFSVVPDPIPAEAPGAAAAPTK